jgi:hypothetical protein
LKKSAAQGNDPVADEAHLDLRGAGKGVESSGIPNSIEMTGSATA